MHKMAIVADDLTSATDCGIRFALQGLRAFVVLNRQFRKSSDIREADVIAIDTDTRSKTTNEAYEIVREVALRTRAECYHQIYKSVDSTLRGNLGSEIDAVMDVYNFTFCVFAPAFPYYGRTTVKGRHFLKRTPLSRTEFANDPKNPVTEDDLPKLLSHQSRRKVGLVELGCLRNGNVAVLEEISSLRGRGVELIVFDAQIEADLQRIVRIFSKKECNILWAGSTGLARHLAQAFETKLKPVTLKKSPSPGRLQMLVSGTTSETTRRQLEVFKQETSCVVAEMCPIDITLGGRRASVELQRCKTLLVEALSGGNDVVLQVPAQHEVAAATALEGRKIGMRNCETSAKISQALAEIVRRVVEICELGGLIVIGGDTAKMVCNRLGGAGIELLEEVEPGIPLGRLIGDVQVLIVTKAGAFGSSRVLVKASNLLKAKAFDRVLSR
jgi:uncharacterized protein YgbK (DUF1537 family)